MNKYLEKIASSNWIAGATKHKGKLHENLGIPEGQPIPESTLEEAAKRPGKVGKEARLAETLKKMAETNQNGKPFKTALTESAIGLPLDIAAAGIGGKLGSKFGAKGAAIGATAGTVLAGLGANYGVLKHQQMKQQG